MTSMVVTIGLQFSVNVHEGGGIGGRIICYVGSGGLPRYVTGGTT